MIAPKNGTFQGAILVACAVTPLPGCTAQAFPPARPPLPFAVQAGDGAAQSPAAVVQETDFAAAAPFRVRFKGSTAAEKTGNFSPPWSGNLWDGGSEGVIVVVAGADGKKVLSLVNLSGKPSVQFYNWQPIPLAAGTRYRVCVRYQTAGGGTLLARGENVTEAQAPLAATGTAYRDVDVSVSVSGAAKLTVLIQNTAIGEANALRVLSVRVESLGADAVKPVTPAAPPATNATNATNAATALPDLAPASVADTYYASIMRELQTAHLPVKAVLLGARGADATLPLFERNSVQGSADFSDVSVAGQPFGKAIRIHTERKPQEWMTHLQLFSPEKIRAGDTLYVTAWVRAVQVTDGKNAGVGRLYASEERGGNQKDSEQMSAGDFAVPRTWTRIHFPLVVTRDFGASDTLKLMFTWGQHTAQTVEFGGLAAFDLGPGIAKTRLPHAALPLDYAGRGANAPWRKAAAMRIEKYRKGNLSVMVLDASGKPVPGARVSVAMTRHAFYFGASLPVGMLPGQHVKPLNADFARTAGASDTDKKRLQTEFLRLFNSASTSVTWSVWGGADDRISQNDVLAGLTWLNAHGIACFDSQAVYPSPEFTPPSIRDTLENKEHAAQFGQAVKDYITFSAQKLPVQSLEIANEIEGRPQYTDILGRDVVPQWFRWAKEANPRKSVMINGGYLLGEGTIQTGAGHGAMWPGRDVEGLQYYHDLIAYLLRNGAPIDYIGIQNHAGLGAPGPEAVLKTLTQFSAAFGKPIEVSEFEVTLQNGDDPAQRAYQADYVRDFFTAVFSHPAARGILLQDFWQPGAWQSEGASCFFNADWSLNPHGKVYEDLVLKQWWTRRSGTTAANGTLMTRGFLGDYEISVRTPSGATKTVRATLPRGGANVVVRLEGGDRKP